MSETGLYIGKWAAIGYTMSAQTPSFTYSDNVTGTDVSVAIPEDATAAWSAAARVGLNDCTEGSTWNLFVKKDGTKNGLVWGASIKKGAASTSPTDMDAECSVLTPQFINLRVGSI